MKLKLCCPLMSYSTSSESSLGFFRTFGYLKRKLNRFEEKTELPFFNLQALITTIFSLFSAYKRGQNVSLSDWVLFRKISSRLKETKKIPPCKVDRCSKKIGQTTLNFCVCFSSLTHLSIFTYYLQDLHLLPLWFATIITLFFSESLIVKEESWEQKFAC